MNTKLLFGALLLGSLAACDVVVVDRPYHHRRAVVVYEPAPRVVVQASPVVVAPPPPAPAVVVQDTPAYMEEGTVVGGVVVAPPAYVDGYVMMGGGWYYWHPGFHTWVHAHPPYGWRPAATVHVYRNWSEHPMYRATVAVGPAPVAPSAPVVVAQGAPVVAAAPVYVEEGSVVGGVVVTPPSHVEGYVMIGGGWYYWHPGIHTWVHAHPPRGWHPGGDVHVYRNWSEHPMFHGSAAVEVRTAPVVVAPSAPVVAAAPVYVEEGAMVGGVVVTPPAHVDGYVMLSGGWYYWHPGLRCWVHAHPPRGWRPGADVQIYHGWSEHPMYRH